MYWKDQNLENSCECNEGYSGTGQNCSDVDECQIVPNPCDTEPNSQCANNVGSYQCDCLNGYIDIQGECKDVDECFEPQVRKIIFTIFI